MRRNGIYGASMFGCALSLVLVPAAHGGKPPAAAVAFPPPLLLANVYDESEVDLQEYWVSEKYDGIRAYWNGTQLLTRAGNLIRAPDWFIADWPMAALDGELWIGHGEFETLLATVRDEVPDPRAWRRVRFMVFDVPSNGGHFTARKRALDELVASLGQPWVQAVEHWRVLDHDALQAQLDRIVEAGGEGLMLHRDAALYHAQRRDDLLKVKRYEDAEAVVIGHVPGKGKYEGMLGALEVQRPDGLRFRIGTGFSDEERRHPPSLGTWVTYRYHGSTQNGVPKFASFVRIREEL
jgi:DNA ligase 1